MKKNMTFATIAASALAALTIGLAAPAVADPSGTGTNPGNGQDTVSTVPGNGYPTTGKNQYGGYQNPNKTPRGHHH
jgi:hypothetical protein